MGCLLSKGTECTSCVENDTQQDIGDLQQETRTNSTSSSTSSYRSSSSEEIWDLRRALLSVESSSSEQSQDDAKVGRRKLTYSPSGNVRDFHSRAKVSNQKIDSLSSKLGSFPLQRESSPREVKNLKQFKDGSATFLNQYLIIRFLGEGTSGRVFLSMDITCRKLYALKVIKRKSERVLKSGKHFESNIRGEKGQESAIRHEVELMKKLGMHRNIAGLREIIDDPLSSKIILVMDYFEGGPVMTRDALKLKKHLPEDLARYYFRDMLCGLEFLHSNKVIHGDLKPENILMSCSGCIALSDFGSSKKINEEEHEFLHKGGTPAFLAPEILNPKGKYRARQADIYALGVCLFVFLFGQLPFTASSVPDLAKLVLRKSLSYPSSPEISAEAKDLLQQLLAKDPEKRPTLVNIACHPWITKKGSLPALFKGSKSIELFGNGNELNATSYEEKLSGLLSDEFEVRTFEKGDYLFQQNSQLDEYMMFIIDGTCDMVYHSSKISKFLESAERELNSIASECLEIGSSIGSSELSSWTLSRKSSSFHYGKRLQVTDKIHEDGVVQDFLSSQGTNRPSSSRVTSNTSSTFLKTGNGKESMAHNMKIALKQRVNEGSMFRHISDFTRRKKAEAKSSLGILNNNATRLKKGNSMNRAYSSRSRAPDHILQFSQNASAILNQTLMNDGQYKVSECRQGMFVGEQIFFQDDSKLARKPFSSEGKYDSSLIATSDTIHVAMVPKAYAIEYFSRNPLAEQVLAEVHWSRQDDLYIMEALILLSSIHG